MPTTLRPSAAPRPLMGTLAALTLALGLVLTPAFPALAHGGEAGHTHGMAFEGADFLDPIVWDGVAQVDCSAAGQGNGGQHEGGQYRFHLVMIVLSLRCCNDLPRLACSHTLR